MARTLRLLRWKPRAWAQHWEPDNRRLVHKPVKNGNSHTVTCKGVNIAFLLWYYHAGTAWHAQITHEEFDFWLDAHDTSHAMSFGPAIVVRDTNVKFPVKAPKSPKCSVNGIGTVRSCNDHHLHKELLQLGRCWEKPYRIQDFIKCLHANTIQYLVSWNLQTSGHNRSLTRRWPDHGPWFHPLASRAAKPRAFPWHRWHHSDIKHQATNHVKCGISVFKKVLWGQNPQVITPSVSVPAPFHPLTRWQATTSPDVLSRLGAMESISSMKMIAGEFFLMQTGRDGPCLVGAVLIWWKSVEF